MTVFAASLSSTAFINAGLSGLQHSTKLLADSVERLAGGNRVLSVGDDVAAVSVAAGLQSQLSGLKAAGSSVAHGSSLLQVVAGGLSRVSDIIDDLAAVAEQATSISLTSAERGFLEAQFAQKLADIDEIVSNTTFKGSQLLDGLDIDFQVGEGIDDTLNITLDSVATSELFAVTPDLADVENAEDAQEAVETASNAVQTLISRVTGTLTSFEKAAGSIEQSIGGIAAAHNALADTDVVNESDNFLRQQLKVNTAAVIIAQARNLPSSLLNLLQAPAAGNS